MRFLRLMELRCSKASIQYSSGFFFLIKSDIRWHRSCHAPCRGSTMKIALPVCGNRISTVFDAADELLTIENNPGVAPVQSRTFWREDTLIARTARIKELGAQILICGALSGVVKRMLEAAGIRVIPFIRGTVDDVFDAFCNGKLSDKRFFLPGCAPCGGQGGQNRRHHGHCKTGGKGRP
jgi:predicted Fe-Mo cluster-binding NifX family protein